MVTMCHSFPTAPERMERVEVKFLKETEQPRRHSAISSETHARWFRINFQVHKCSDGKVPRNLSRFVG